MLKRLNLWVMALVAGLVTVFAQYASAEPVTLPSTGVDVSEYITLLVTGLGSVVGAAIAASFAFFIIRRGVGIVKGWIRG